MTSSVVHKISWWVYAGHPSERNLIPRVSTMRGSWAYEAKCSCGWESRTGGALEREIRRQITDHKAEHIPAH